MEICICVGAQQCVNMCANLVVCGEGRASALRVSVCACVCKCVYCLAVYGFVRPYGVLSGECTTHLALLLALVFTPSVPPLSSLSHPFYFSLFFESFVLPFFPSHFTSFRLAYMSVVFPLQLQPVSNKMHWPSNGRFYITGRFIDSNTFMLHWLICILFGEDWTPVTECINFLSKIPNYCQLQSHKKLQRW